jgi:transcriptional regulator with XRE-family HTH domain
MEGVEAPLVVCKHPAVTPDDPEQNPLTEAARQRLREALLHRKMTQRDLSREIRVGESTVGAILSGRQKPLYATILAMMSALRVHPSWILFGLAPAYIDDPPATRESQTSLKPVRLTTGVDRWLEHAAEATTPAERAFLRSCEWPSPDETLPDLCYQLSLTAYRQAVAHTQQPKRANGH